MGRKTSILLRTLSLRKLGNMFLLWASYHYSRLLKKPHHWGNPAKIGIEPTTSCNLRCPECPSGLRSFTRPTGMLNLENFKAMVDQLAPDLVYLLMYFQGEPFLNQDFLSMAAYSARKKVFTATSTNGHFLTMEKARETVASGIHEVLISIDGTTQETYEQYRVGGSLEKAVQGVRNLRKARDEAGARTPHILVQFLVVGPNEHQVDEIREKGLQWGADKVVLKSAQIYDYEQGSPLIPQNEKYARYSRQSDGTYKLKNPLKNQCWKLWSGAEITWDGKVLPCCFDKDADHLMGELGNQKFSDIWRGDAYRHFRGQILKSRNEIDICRNCTEGLKVWV